jgi:hypothetical protein
MGAIVAYTKEPDGPGVDDNKRRRDGMVALGARLDLRFQDTSVDPTAFKGLVVDRFRRNDDLIICELLDDRPNPDVPAGRLILKFQREDDGDNTTEISAANEYFMSVVFPQTADHSGIDYLTTVAQDIQNIPLDGAQSPEKYLAAFAFLSRCK